MTRNLFLAACLSMTILPASLGFAQSNAETIAATLQSWRDACSDPNPDLALGYLMDAVATGSVDVRKACLRQVLLSDNADLQNSALRVLMTSLPVVRFRMTEEIRPANSRIAHLIASLRTGLLFQVSDGNTQAGTATWRPAIDTPQPGEEATGTMTVFGSDVHWAGMATYYGKTYPCSLTVSLVEGQRLAGTLVCESSAPIPVEANPFD